MTSVCSWFGSRMAYFGIALSLLGGLLCCSGCGRSAASEADAAAALKKLGAFVVKDNNSGMVSVVNISTIDDPTKGSEAVNLISQLVKPSSVTCLGVQLTPDDVAKLGAIRSLIELNLQGTNVDDAGIAKLSGLRKLSTLYLDETQVTNQALETISGFSELKVLGLGRTKVSGALTPLAKLKKLTWIVLSGIEVNDAMFASLGEISSLQTVTMVDATFGDEGLQKLQKARPEMKFDTQKGSLGG